MKYHYSVDMNTDSSLSVILRHINSSSKVFEFGPADGYMTEFLKNSLNCEVFCLEIDELAAEKAKKYCDKMIVADLNQLDWLDQVSDHLNSFDFLVFADVLEHLIDPEKILHYLTKVLLKDNGKVLISLPHIGHTAVILELMAGKFEYRDTGLLDRTHLTFFTRDNVLNLLNYANLHPVDWHNICMYPEQTELSSSYNSVPIEVQRYLKNKIDAHVYQFVVCAEKKNNNQEGNNFVSPEVSSYRYSKFIQLFWNTGEGYSEEKSIRLPLEAEGSYKTYNFEFHNNEEENVTSIRLDPINFAGYLHFRSFKIYGLSIENNQFELIGNDEITPIYGSEILKNSNGLNIFAYNDDPQLQYELSDINGYRLFRIEIEMTYYSKIDPHLLYKKQQDIEMKELDIEMRELDHKLQNLFDVSSEIFKYIEKSSEFTNEINKLHLKINETERNNFRLQSQFDEISSKNNELNDQISELTQRNYLLEKQLEDEKSKNKKIQKQLSDILESFSWKLLSVFKRKERDTNS